MGVIDRIHASVVEHLQEKYPDAPDAEIQRMAGEAMAGWDWLRPDNIEDILEDDHAGVG
jgi:hypothetical protein